MQNPVANFQRQAGAFKESQPGINMVENSR